jgi:hypothetical protein
MIFNSTENKPKEGKLLICYCPYWCELEYQIATYEDGSFDYPDSPNNKFDECVEGWVYLNE